MKTGPVLAVGVLLALTGQVAAMDFSVDAYADLRLVAPAGERSWVDGGLGKFRFGASQPSPNFRFAEAVGQATLAVTDDLHAVASLRIEPEQRSGIDVLESYVAWRPQAMGDWRWAVKAGAFFPPVSLENSDLGWTSPYTLTPSALNSWVGEELRTIGGEGTLSHATPLGTIAVTAALFCCNEPAGTLIAYRGWALDDRPTGLFERVREPDATLKLFGETPPGRVGLFQNVDGHLGWYAGADWDVSGIGHAAVLRYENRADPRAVTSGDEAWATAFWSASFKTRILDAAVLAQALSGETSIGSYGGPLHTTNFQSAFLLASYDLGDWRLSGRAEAFATRNLGGTLLDEDGHAFTGAVNWSARDWLRLTAELIALDSRRRERVLAGSPAQRSDTQFQLGARFFL